MRNLRVMANSIHEDIQITTDGEDSHKDMMIPMLDVQVEI